MKLNRLLLTHKMWKFTVLMMYMHYASCLAYSVGQSELIYQTNSGKSCIRCPPGYYFIEDCNIPHTIAVCKPCPAGTFSNTSNRALECARCMPHCESDVLITVQKCNATADMVCDCPPGETLENPSDKYHATCKPSIGCGPGSGVIQQATLGKNPVCAECIPGLTFSPQNSSREPCYPCTTCPNSEVLQECNITHDSVCNCPRDSSWGVYAAIPSLSINGFVILAVIIKVIHIRCYRKSKPKVDEEEHSSLTRIQSKISRDSGWDQNSAQTEMEHLAITWGPIFRMVSSRIQSNWKDVIRSLFHATGVEYCDEIIQEIQHNNQTVTEQIYQCLLKWEQQSESPSTEVLVQVLNEKFYPRLVRELQNRFQSEFPTDPDTTIPKHTFQI